MVKPTLNQLGPLQQRVLKILWEQGEATVRQVLDCIGNRDLAYTTILSTMQKLEKIGWVKHRKEGRTYVYSAQRSREQEGSKSIKGILKGVFGGDALLMFQHFMEDEQFTDDQLRDIKKMIDRKRREGKDGNRNTGNK